MIPQVAPHEWSADALHNKAQLYTEVLLSFRHDDWQFVFWSTLSLELLARAALANVSPTLVADAKSNWNNLLYSLGRQPTVPKFIPKSIDISEVFNRLEQLMRDFTPELEDFCKGHMSKRNEELHSGGTPFVDIKNTSWLPTYYQVYAVLLGSMGDSLDRFLGSAEAATAKAMIAAARDESAKSIIQLVKARKVVWDYNSNETKAVLVLQSSTWATRQDGHRVSCPSCDCDAILSGSAIAPPRKTITENEITETQEYLPSKFECVACGLKISGLSHLSASGLGDTYNATFTYDVNDLRDFYEPDFNE